MDKLLLAAFLSTLAGFITAVVSVVKLVNEKENKISEFRQSWTDSARSSIAELAAKLTANTANLEHQSRLTEYSIVLEGKTDEKNKNKLERVRDDLETTRADILLKRHDLHQSYALCRLHFKPLDISFNRIEQKVELIYSQWDSLMNSKVHADRVAIKAKCYELTTDIVDIGRDILKTEWERVKTGEYAYKSTKKYSFWGGVLLLFFLFSIGYHAFLLTAKPLEKSLIIEPTNSIKTDITQCWKIQNLEGRIFSFNSCTGDTVEVAQAAPAKRKDSSSLK